MPWRMVAPGYSMTRIISLRMKTRQQRENEVVDRLNKKIEDSISANRALACKDLQF